MKPAAILFCAAALPRLAYLLLIRPPIESQYWALSGSLVRTGTFTIDGLPVTDFEPLYPLFLAGARLIARDSVLAVQLMQIAVASLGAVLLYRLVLGRTGSARAGVFGGLLFAGYPLLVRHAATVGDSSLTAEYCSSGLPAPPCRSRASRLRRSPAPGSGSACSAGPWCCR